MKPFKVWDKKRIRLLRAGVVLMLTCMIGLHMGWAFGAQETVPQTEEQIVAQAPSKQNDWMQIGIVCFMGLATISYGIFLIRRADDE